MSRRSSYSSSVDTRRPPTWRSMSSSKRKAPASVTYVFAEPQPAPSLGSAAASLSPPRPRSKMSDVQDSTPLSPPEQPVASSSKLPEQEPAAAEAVDSTDGTRTPPNREEIRPIALRVESALNGTLPSSLSVTSATPTDSTTTQNSDIQPTNHERIANGDAVSSVSERPPSRSGWFPLGSRKAKEGTTAKSVKELSSQSDIPPIGEPAPVKSPPPSIIAADPSSNGKPATTEGKSVAESNPAASQTTHITSSQAAPIPFPTSSSPPRSPTLTSKPLSLSSSPPATNWFSSWSRRQQHVPSPEAKEPESVVAEQSPAPADSAAKPVETARTAEETPNPAPALRTMPQTTRVAIPVKVTRSADSERSIACSIDDNVPSPVLTPPSSPSPVSQSRVSNMDGQRERKLSSLNPSVNRFTLSIPLLGRPKVPLDEAVRQAAAQAAQSFEPPKVEQQLVDQPSITISKADEQTSEASSWWNYVGLGSSRPASTTGVIGPPATARNDDHNVSTRDEAQTSSAEAQTVLTEPRSVLEVKPNDPSGRATASLRSAETSTSGVWLNPWTWWTSPSQNALDAPLGGKTEAEMVKEEALRRSKSDTNISELRATDASELSNKVLVSTTDSPEARASWLSFFSSRQADARAIKEKGEAMETMDLDEEGEALTPPHPPASLSTQPQKSQASMDQAPSASVRNPARTESKKPAPPLTDSATIKQKVADSKARSSSPAPSKKSLPPKAPNLVLPTFADTFDRLPRSRPPRTKTSSIKKTVGLMSTAIFGDERAMEKLSRDARSEEIGHELPRKYSVFRGKGKQRAVRSDVLKGCKRVVVVGVHGWFPGAIVRSVFGEPTGTSTKFANMMCGAVEDFVREHGTALEKITSIPLEGEGVIEKRVEKLYQAFIANEEWISDLRNADVVFFATHSQGSIASTHLLNRFIQEGLIRSSGRSDLSSRANASVETGSGPIPVIKAQRICCLALCGIHLGPLLYLKSSSLVQPYLQYFESAAASELFEFQDTESEVSRRYFKALQNVLDHGVKFVYMASFNDQVVPIYSGVFTAIKHPLVLRAMYIDGDAYSSSDFLCNLLVLLLRIKNAGLSDAGLIAHLSEATAGSLSGVGHSSAYEESSCYRLAVQYLFLCDEGKSDSTTMGFERFNSKLTRNDYEIPWALRDLIADEGVYALFSEEILKLRDAFDDWVPKTNVLKDLKRKLEPVRRLAPASRL